MEVRVQMTGEGGVAEWAAGAVTRLHAEMEREAQLLAGDAKRELQANGSVATGKLLQSIQAGVDREPGRLVVWIGLLRHGLNVETGRRPGKQPPRAAIEEWVKRKGILPTGGGRDQAFITLAWLIAKRIGWRRGGKPAPLSAIMAWMEDEGIRPTREQVVRFAAQAIAEKIGRHGIKPRPFIVPAVAAMLRRLNRNLSAALRGEP